MVKKTTSSPYDLSAALTEMKAINKIFSDWLLYGGMKVPEEEKDKVRFDKIVVLSPFSLIAIEPLKEGIKVHRNEKSLLSDVKELKHWAEINTNLYSNGEGKSAVSRTLYYEIRNEITVRVEGTQRIQFIENHKDRQVFLFMFELYLFCVEVKNLADRFIKFCEAQKDERDFNTPPDHYPEKWYALYHLIALSVGKTLPTFAAGSKEEIVLYAKNHYNIKGEGFYRAWISPDYDLNKIPVLIANLSPKARTFWKTVIREISGNDAEVVLWLNRQVN